MEIPPRNVQPKSFNQIRKDLDEFSNAPIVEIEDLLPIPRGPIGKLATAVDSPPSTLPGGELGNLLVW
jgi:hypothetical protein